ncbi:high affinity immunoglobulin gamma Fc receptor I-like [Pholidichthys leucotaenia]
MDASLCLIMSAMLTIRPNKSQFFRYEDITFDCAAPGSSGAWTVRRNTSSVKSEPCKVLQGKSGFGDPEVSSCVLADVYPSDSGVYWCTSGLGQCSNFVNITVTSGVVILDSPAFPLTQGDEVTLRCIYKERYARTATSDFTATFYKNKVFIGTSPNGQMVIQAVSLSDEGFYKCVHPTKGQSPLSWLSVRANAPTTRSSTTTTPPPPPPPVISTPRLVCTILLFILYSSILVLCVHTYQQWAKIRAENKL